MTSVVESIELNCKGGTFRLGACGLLHAGLVEDLRDQLPVVAEEGSAHSRDTGHRTTVVILLKAETRIYEIDGNVVSRV